MGLEKLDAKLAFLAQLGRITDEVMPDVADVVKDELERTTAAGTDPYGEAWQRRKDGGQPLEGAAKHIRVAPIGRRVFVRVTGYIARHHRGRARGGIERPVLPADGIPPAMSRRIKAAVVAHFRALKAGG